MKMGTLILYIINVVKVQSKLGSIVPIFLWIFTKLEC